MKINNYNNTIDYILCVVEKIINLYSEDNIDKYNYCNLLYFLSEIYNSPNLKEYDNKIKNILYELIYFFKNEIEKGNSQYLFYAGIHSGIGKVAVSFNILKNKGIYVDKISLYLNEQLFKYTENNIIYKTNKELCSADYDLLYGVSGVLNYMLEMNIKDNKRIRIFTEYLISLIDISKDMLDQNYMVTSRFYDIFEEKYLDLGVAHGLASILVVLSKVKSNGIYMYNLNDAINYLESIYIKYSEKYNSILIYPNYVNNNNCNNPTNDNNYSFGWCCGNLGILIGLMKSFENNYEKKEYYHKEILKLLYYIRSNKIYYEPVVCHGYASLIATQIACYKNTKDVCFMENLDENLKLLLKSDEKLINSKFGTEYIETIDFLIGRTGVALTLLYMLGEEKIFVKLMCIE